MGNFLNSKLAIAGVNVLVSLAILGGLIAGAASSFLDAGRVLPLTDDKCKTFAQVGPEDITAASAQDAFIGSNDNFNWLMAENIDQKAAGVGSGQLVLIQNLKDAKPDDYEGIYENRVDVLKDWDTGFPEDVAFHPHGMAVTPQWVADEDGGQKKLFVINHAWNQGGNRIEVFNIEYDTENPDTVVGLEWQYNIGGFNDGGSNEDMTSSEFQKQYYGDFNGLNVVGPNDVMIGKWLGVPYKVPGDPAYVPEQAKALLGGQTGIVHCSHDVDENKDVCKQSEAVKNMILVKSIVFSNDGKKAYVTDTFPGLFYEYDHDMTTHELTATGLVQKQTIRVDNLKPNYANEATWMGGGMTNLAGNLAFEAQRISEGPDYSKIQNVPEAQGGAEQFRVNADGEIEHRLLVNSHKLNGWSNAELVGNTIVCGSFIDPNFMMCPYDDSVAWEVLPGPWSATPFVMGGIFLFALQGVGTYFWCKKAGEKSDYFRG